MSRKHKHRNHNQSDPSLFLAEPKAEYIDVILVDGVLKECDEASAGSASPNTDLPEETESVLTVDEISDLTVEELVDLISDDFPVTLPQKTADETIPAGNDAAEEHPAEEVLSEVPSDSTIFCDEEAAASAFDEEMMRMAAEKAESSSSSDEAEAVSAESIVSDETEVPDTETEVSSDEADEQDAESVVLPDSSETVATENSMATADESTVSSDENKAADTESVVPSDVTDAESAVSSDETEESDEEDTVPSDLADTESTVSSDETEADKAEDTVPSDPADAGEASSSDPADAENTASAETADTENTLSSEANESENAGSASVNAENESEESEDGPSLRAAVPAVSGMDASTDPAETMNSEELPAFVENEAAESSETADSEAASSTAESDSSDSESVTASSEPEISGSESVTASSEPETSGSESAAASSEPETSGSENIAASSEPETSGSENTPAAAAASSDNSEAASPSDKTTVPDAEKSASRAARRSASHRKGSGNSAGSTGSTGNSGSTGNTYIPEHHVRPSRYNENDELGGISGRSLEEYLNEIDRNYEERKAARQARLRAKRRKRRIRNTILAVILILLLAGGGSVGYLKYEDQLSFRLPEPLETTVHKLDPVLDGSAFSVLGIGNAETLSAETASAEETSAAETVLATEAETETEAVTEAATEAETEASGSLKQGSVLDPEVASFFTGNEMDESNADIIPQRDATEEATLSDYGIVSSGALLLDLDTGEVVAERNADVVISPASMTKILTVLVAAEHLTEDQLDDTAAMDEETSDYIYQTNCSTADLELDEPVTVRDLFYGTILPSGGDAAMTLAKYVAGSNDAFIDMMNEKVEELGLSSTAHFTNCIGIYNEDLHCTLKDMALILRAAVQNDFCREVLSTHRYTTSSTDSYPDGVELSNWFLRRIEDYDTNGEVRCAKTGFVNEAGCCAASYMLSDSGKHYICVTCHSTSSWQCIYDQIFIYSNYAK